MKKLFSILLLAFFILPPISPLLALTTADADASLPICCRRDGKHHCQGRMPATDTGAQFTAPEEVCPYAPATVVAAHTNNIMAPGIGSAIFAALLSHPTGHAQIESKRRIALELTRQKRGPPASFFL